MSLSLHELALRLGRHLGVSAFDPGDDSNLHPLVRGGARPGDLEAVVTAMNGALQEMWAFAPDRFRELYPLECPVVTAADVMSASDPGCAVLLPEGWEESVLFPLALRRLSVHPDFQPATRRAEIERQAVVARRIVMGLVADEATKIVLPFR